MWPPSTARSGAVSKALSAQIDWALFVRLVKRHRNAGLVFRALGGREGIDPAARAAIAKLSQEIALASMFHMAELKRVAAKFSEAGVPVGVLKGISLAVLAYGDPMIRHSKDLDLLVADAHIDDALRVLESEGYRRVVPATGLSPAQTCIWRETQKHMTLESPGGVQVELHWKPLMYRSMRGIAADKDAWYDAVIASTLRVSTLKPDLLFAYLCAHGGYHAWFRLKWLADIGALLAAASPADMARLYRSAKAVGLGLAAAQAIVLSARLLATPVDGELLRELRRDWRMATLERLALRAMTWRDDAEPEQTAFGKLPIVATGVLMANGVSEALREGVRGIVNPHDLLLRGGPDWVARCYPLLRMPLWIWDRLVRS